MRIEKKIRASVFQTTTFETKMFTVKWMIMEAWAESWSIFVEHL